jgi:hypothetical protein
LDNNEQEAVQEPTEQEIEEEEKNKKPIRVQERMVSWQKHYVKYLGGKLK